MKKCLLFVFAMVLYVGSFAQISVSGGSGLSATYTSFTKVDGLFAAINAADQTGNAIVVSITADVLDEDGVTALTGAAGMWSTLSITPSGARTISGAVTGHLIDLSGADNVTIDGLNASGNSLTISNTATGASSTIRFIADATGNLVQNCTLTGSTTSFGVVNFSTGTATGNDNNTINYCNIGPAGANLPLNGIYSLGSTAVIDNSTNSVTNCNIYDYFNTTSSTCAMNINSFNSAWTISNNKLFQSANRTYTTANTHYGINVLSGAGYTITGNTIGFANSTGTGTTNMIGLTSGTLGGTFPGAYTAGGTANATRYVAINCAFLAGGAVSSIQSNTIAGFALYTSSGAATTNGIFCGINVTSGNANIGTATGNTIGSASGSIYTACTTSGGTIVGIYASSVNTVTIANNMITRLDAMGTTATISGGVTGINVAGALGVFSINGNTIGGSTNPDLRMGNLLEGANLSNVGTTFNTASGIGKFEGILSSATGPVTIGSVASPNIIRNAYVNASNSSSSGCFFRGIDIVSGSGIFTITGNSIYNLSTFSSNITLSTATITGLGIYIASTTTGSVITQNTIYGLSALNTGAIGTNIAGIGVANITNLTISKNKIYDLRNASTSATVTAPGTASGILVRSATTSLYIVNNMISLGTAQTTNTSFIGIYGNHGSTPNPICNFYYNTIDITGTAASGAQPSFGYLRGDFSATARTPTVDIRNNLITNDRTGGTGKHYAIANNYGATASVTGWGTNASNYNVLNAAAATVGYWTADKTFADWKTASASDANSITAIPVTFADVATGDLHLNMGVTPTQLESGAIVIAAYTTDYDNDTRPGPVGSVNGGAFAPDFGADEFDGVFLDLAPPTITYTPLLNTPFLFDRDLYVTITDNSGVGSGANQPVLYWSINGTLPYTGPLAPASVVGNVYKFTFGSGVVLGNTVSYFVVAQDASTNANVTSYPAGATVANNPPTASAPPPAPSTYTIVDVPLNGDYTVGLTLFNKMTGQNIYFDKVVTKVMKEVFVEESMNSDQNSAATDNLKAKNGTVENTGSGTLNIPAGRMELKEVEEISWVPMENGQVYNGPLSVNLPENPNLPNAPSAGVYATITAAVADLNLRGVSGPVRFLLNDVSYTTGETYPIIVNVANENLPTASNPVTIKPNSGVTTLIQGAAAASPLMLIRSSFVSVDGSNTIGGTTRDLTIENTSITTPQVISIRSTGTTPIVNCTVKNSILINGVNSSSAFVVCDIAGTAGYFNNITLQNNSLQKAYIASYFLATVAAGNGSGSLVTGNDFNTSGANSVRLVGVYTQGVDGITVSNNNIGNMANTVDASNMTGIWFATATVNSTISGNTISTVSSTTGPPRGIAVSSGVTNANVNITGNTISGISTPYSSAPYGIYVFGTTTNVTVEKNKVSDILNSNTGGYGARGIHVNTGILSSNILVKNNFVWNVRATGDVSSTYWGIGIGIEGATGGVKVYDNSVNLYGTYVGYTSATVHAAFAVITTTATSLDVRGNIFVNTFDNTNSTTDKSYAINSLAANSAFTDINYNDYHWSASAPGVLGYLVADQTTLPLWQTATGKDLQSIIGDPLFVLNTNLHIQTTAVSPVSNVGVSLSPDVTDDIDGDPRPNPLDSPAFDIGADEYYYEPPAVTDPTDVLATAISSSEIDVAFTKNVNDNNVVICWSSDPLSFTTPSGPPQTIVNAPFAGGRLVYNGGTSPGQHTGLPQVTKYYYKVWSYAFDGVATYTYSPGVNTDATTECAEVATLTENFDGVVVPALPLCWTKYTSPSFTGQAVVTTTTSPLSPLNCASLYNSTATLLADAPLLITPPISNLNDGTNWLKFAAKGNGTTLSVIVGTVSDLGVFTPFTTVTGLSATAWKSKYVDFTSYSGPDKYIAFQHPMTTTATYVYIDDVSWEATAPTLFVDPMSLAFGFVPNGGTSAEQTYSLSGMFLSGLDGITVTAPAGFEVSLTTGTGFGSSVLVPNTGPELAATPVFVLFKPTLASTDYSGNITNAGGGANTVNVPVTGTTKLVYCTSMASSTIDEEIYSVTVNGATNALACGVVAPGPGSIAYRYSNFLTGPSLTSIQQGAPVSFTVEENECDGATYYSFGTGIWIDYNQDGDFTDAGEEVFKESAVLIGPRNITNSFVVPSGATLGQTVMRITVAETFAGATLTPCLAYSYGETEDYYVTITAATTPVLGAVPPSLGFGYVPVGGNSTPQPYVLSGVSLANNGTLTVHAPTGFSVCETSGGTYVTDLNIPYSGTTLSQTIYAKFSPGSAGDYSDYITNVAGTASANVAVTGTTTITYCTAGSVTCDEYISRVQLNTIDNGSACSTGGYADYSAISTSLSSGSSTLLTVTNGLGYSGDQCGVWIDWNNNGNFYDDAAITVSGQGAGGPYTATITPPVGAVETGVRMRVRITYTGVVDPCGITTYGEVEDYTIMVTPPLALDAMTVSIDNITTAFVAPGTILVPKATVKNVGTTSPVTFDVTIQGTDGYAGTVLNVTLNAGEETQVTFANWSPAEGYWSLQVCTQLSGDMNSANNCKSLPLLVFSAPNKTVYAYNAYAGTGTDPEGPASFNLTSPGTLNSLADQSTLQFVEGGTWANGEWYGTVYNTAAPYDFVKIDPVTGARTVIGDMGLRMLGLSWNQANTTMYAVGGASLGDLYTIDLATGLPTLVGTNTGRVLINLAINNAGEAYAIDIQGQVFGSMNLTTGAFVPVGALASPLSYAQDMEFDRETGVLYAAAYDATGWLGWVDKATGAVVKLGDFEGGGEITGFAIPYSTTPTTKTLNLKVYLEGLCMDRDLGSGLVPPPAGEMYEALNDMGAPNFAPGIADKVTVELHDVANYNDPPVVTFPDVDLSTTGNISITGISALYNGTYYITIKHRNSIETTSAEFGVSFAGSVINYDFSTAASQAYGDNQKSIHSVFAIFGGNSNQDPIGDNQLLVDSGDMNDVENASVAITFGYVVTDCNGDGIVDSGDMNVVENNSINLIGVITPP